MKAILYINQFSVKSAERNSLVTNLKFEKGLLDLEWPLQRP